MSNILQATTVVWEGLVFRIFCWKEMWGNRGKTERCDKKPVKNSSENTAFSFFLLF